MGKNVVIVTLVLIIGILMMANVGYDTFVAKAHQQANDAVDLSLRVVEANKACEEVMKRLVQ